MVSPTTTQVETLFGEMEYIYSKLGALGVTEDSEDCAADLPYKSSNAGRASR
jgi:hypothetical protein